MQIEAQLMCLAQRAAKDWWINCFSVRNVRTRYVITIKDGCIKGDGGKMKKE